MIDNPDGSASPRRHTRNRRVMTLADFTLADIEALEQALPPGEGAAFNQEVESDGSGRARAMIEVKRDDEEG